MYRPLLEKLGITYPQYLVLVVLWERKEAPIKDLGEALELDTGTLTPLLKRMEASGLLQRTRLKEDERVVMITLTEKGEELKQEAMCVPLSLLDSMDMTKEQVQEINALIKSLSEKVAHYRAP